MDKRHITNNFGRKFTEVIEMWKIFEWFYLQALLGIVG